MKSKIVLISFALSVVGCVACQSNRQVIADGGSCIEDSMSPKWCNIPIEQLKALKKVVHSINEREKITISSNVVGGERTKCIYYDIYRSGLATKIIEYIDVNSCSYSSKYYEYYVYKDDFRVNTISSISICGEGDGRWCHLPYEAAVAALSTVSSFVLHPPVVGEYPKPNSGELHDISIWAFDPGKTNIDRRYNVVVIVAVKIYVPESKLTGKSLNEFGRFQYMYIYDENERYLNIGESVSANKINLEGMWSDDEMAVERKKSSDPRAVLRKN